MEKDLDITELLKTESGTIPLSDVQCLILEQQRRGISKLEERVMRIESTLPTLATKDDIEKLKKELIPMGKDAAKWQLIKALFTTWSGRISLLVILLAFVMAGEQMVKLLLSLI